MIRLLVTDLDGTLLDQHKSIDPRNKVAIEAMMVSEVDVWPQRVHYLKFNMLQLVLMVGFMSLVKMVLLFIQRIMRH